MVCSLTTVVPKCSDYLTWRGFRPRINELLHCLGLDPRVVLGMTRTAADT